MTPHKIALGRAPWRRWASRRPRDGPDAGRVDTVTVGGGDTKLSHSSTAKNKLRNVGATVTGRQFDDHRR